MKKYLGIELFSLFLICWSFYFAITNYPKLPDEIPTHFDANGQADDWRPKSWGNVLYISYVALGMEIIFTVCTLIITKSKNPLRFINLPISRARILALPKKAMNEIVEITIRLMVIIKSIIIVMLVYGSYSTIQIALGMQEGLGKVMWLFTVALFIVVGWVIFNIYKVVWKAEKGNYSTKL